MHLGLCGHRQAAPYPIRTCGCVFPRTLGGRLPPPQPRRRGSVLSIGYCCTFRPPIGRAPPPPFCVVNPCEARSSGWVILPPHPSQTDWVPAGPRPVAARVGVRPVGHPPAFQAQSGFVGPAGDWLGARRLVENLVSAERGGERRAAPPPPPGGGASLSSSGPAREPAHNHSLPALAPFHPQAPIQLFTCILLFSQSLGNPPPHLSPPSFFLAPLPTLP